MSDETRKWELEVKADRVLYRLPVKQISYIGDGFPWPVTDEDLADCELVDPLRRTALKIGYQAAHIGANHDGESETSAGPYQVS